jgi:hypothetical protein
MPKHEALDLKVEAPAYHLAIQGWSVLPPCIPSAGNHCFAIIFLSPCPWPSAGVSAVFFLLQTYEATTSGLGPLISIHCRQTTRFSYFWLPERTEGLQDL